MSSANEQRSSGDDIDANDITMRIGREELVIRNRYEALSIANDVLIGILFLLGSILFLWESSTGLATWLFVIGSAEFLLRPVIRLARRTHLKRFGADRDRTDHQGDY